MHKIVTDMRGSRAFDNTAGKVIALAAGALGLASLTPMPAASAAPALSGTKPVTKPLVPAVIPTNDVTLDFVAADIADVLKALALQTHTNIVAGTDVKGVVTVSLAHVSLDEALNMISHLSGFQYAKIGRSYVVGSAMTLAGMGGDALVQTAMVNYLYSAPDDLTGIVKQVVPSVKVTPGKSAGGSGGMLVLTGSPADLEQARQVIQQSEAALSKNIADAQTLVYNIKYASADDLQTVLARLVPDLIVTPGPSQRTPPVAPSTADAGGATSTTTSYGATATGGTVTAMTGNLPVKATTNSLLLTGGDTDIARARQILASVDVRPAQINFEAKITDLDDTLTRDLGLTYSFAGATTRIGELVDNTIGTPTLGDNGERGKVSNLGTFARTAISNFVDVGLKAAQAKGDARILASPNISAVDGQPAAIFIGSSITYISSITTSATGQNITTATASGGVKLFITGKVNNDGYVTVNLHPEVSAVTLVATSGGAQLPTISTREATTTLRVRDGDYIALGGLAQNSETKTSNQVPLLSDIPIIGNLFRYDNKQRDHRELTIFIKVSIAKDQQ